MLKTIRCTVNGKARELSFDVRASLLEVLRAEGLTSSKQGCGVGECGACTVLVDNIPVDSCIFSPSGRRKTIRTTEGRSQGQRFPASSKPMWTSRASGTASARPASS
ncbi:MAG: 2Fe-2S iron-sulfur cluster-binding protein [Bilophila wadsworthia]